MCILYCCFTFTRSNANSMPKHPGTTMPLVSHTARHPPAASETMLLKNKKKKKVGQKLAFIRSFSYLCKLTYKNAYLLHIHNI